MRFNWYLGEIDSPNMSRKKKNHEIKQLFTLNDHSDVSENAHKEGITLESFFRHAQVFFVFHIFIFAVFNGGRKGMAGRDSHSNIIYRKLIFFHAGSLRALCFRWRIFWWSVVVAFRTWWWLSKGFSWRCKSHLCFYRSGILLLAGSPARVASWAHWGNHYHDL